MMMPKLIYDDEASASSVLGDLLDSGGTESSIATF